MATLKTDYVNDVLNTDVNEERTYNLVDTNGNIIYEGVRIRETTALSTVGDNYGALEINEQNTEINRLETDKQDKLTNPLTQSDVINSLNSGATNKPLSAAQGYALDQKITNGRNVIAKFKGLTIGADDDVYMYESPGNELTIRHGSSSSYSFLTTSNLQQLVDRFITTPIVSISSSYALANLCNDVGNNSMGFKFFTNWTGSADFPAPYGSGVCMKCEDASWYLLYYLTTSGRFYVGTYHNSTPTWVEK